MLLELAELNIVLIDLYSNVGFPRRYLVPVHSITDYGMG